MRIAPPRREGPPGNTLEPLVRYPKGAEGRVVTVSGTFRGANLFDDLPHDSRRSEDDWVLRDGPFSIWITGKDPKGKGFSLGASYRSHFNINYSGTIALDNEFVPPILQPDVPTSGDVKTTFKFPDILTFGLAINVTPKLLWSFDVHTYFTVLGETVKGQPL